MLMRVSRIRDNRPLSVKIPLGKAFVENDIIKIRKGADVKELSRNDVEKVGTF